jgi:cation:H+ antiporter
VFTLLVTLGLSATLSPVEISHRWLLFDLPAMMVMSFLLFIFLLTRQAISRFEGALLLGGYIVVLGMQFLLT